MSKTLSGLPDKSEKRHIASASDDRYAQHLGAMIVSLLDNTASPDQFIFYIIDAGIKEQNKQHLRDIIYHYGASIQFIAFTIDSSTIFVNRHLSPACYVRLFLSELLDSTINRVLYLDCDIIVRKDVADLWETDLSNVFLAAVDTSDLNRNSVLGIPKDAKYFNSGVLFIHLKKWREQGVVEKFLSVINVYKDKLQYHDQDVLNKIFYDKWQALPPQWNVRKGFYTADLRTAYYSKEEVEQAIDDPAIVHYTEASKPWHYLDNHPRKDEYYFYLNKTEWKGFVPPEKDIIDNLLATKKIIIFGAGNYGKSLLDRLRELHASVAYFLDNDPGKWQTRFMGVTIAGPEQLQSEEKDQIFIFIASMYYDEIDKQLTEMGYVKNKHYCIQGFEYQLQ